MCIRDSLCPAPDRPVPEKRLGRWIWADLPLLSHQRGSGAAPLRTAESGQHPAGTAICRTGGDPEAGLWKTQPHLPEILWSGSKHRLQEIRLWNAGGLKTALDEYDDQSSWSTKTGRYIEIQRLKRFIYILSIPIRSEIFSAGFSCGKVPERKGTGKGVYGTTRCV